jgi:hypothetical protein
LLTAQLTTSLTWLGLLTEDQGLEVTSSFPLTELHGGQKLVPNLPELALLLTFQRLLRHKLNII